LKPALKNSGEYPEGGEADMYISIEGVSREYFLKAKGRYPLRM